MPAPVETTTYFVGHPLFHQEEWVVQAIGQEFPLYFAPLSDSEIVFIRGVAQCKYITPCYEIVGRTLKFRSDANIRVGDWVKIVYAWR